jgi:two-component system, response regulator RegA
MALTDAAVSTALLVDDDAAFRITMQSALRRRGILAKTAATVAEGLTLLEDDPVDLVILDYRMPQEDGLAAIEKYRGRRPDTTIVMLSGYGDIPLAVTALRRGADLFLTKPIEVDRLLSEVLEARSEPRATAHLPMPPLSLNLEQMERHAITAAMHQSGGLVARAARLLGINRRTLQRKLKRMR